MNEVNCKRLILMHSWMTKPDSRNASGMPFFIRWVLIPLIRPALDDMDRAESYLRSDDQAVAGIDYTVVLPAGLNNGAVTGEKDLR